MVLLNTGGFTPHWCGQVPHRVHGEHGTTLFRYPAKVLNNSLSTILTYCQLHFGPNQSELWQNYP